MNSKKSRSGNNREIVAVVLIFAAIAIFLAIISFNPGDSSFNSKTSSGNITENFLGLVGSYSADLLVQLFGFASFLLPIFLLLISIRYFTEDTFRITSPLLLSFMGMGIAAMALFSNFAGQVIYREKQLNAGGIIGENIKTFAQHYLNETGAVIFFTFIIGISVMNLFRLSLRSLSGTIVAGTISFAAGVRAFSRKIISGIKGQLPGRDRRGTPADVEPLVLEPPAGGTKKQSSRKKDAAQPSLPSSPQKFQLPPLSLLDDPGKKDLRSKKENLAANSRLLERKLADFGVEGRVVEVKPGPVITMYELEPAAGVKINKIANLSDDMALAMKAQSVRIIAPIPGKAAVGLEIPNPEREAVRLKEVLQNDALFNSSYRLPIALGVDIVGTPVIADLIKMPHLLIAGTTGSGKSVALNAMICSILFKSTPEEVKLLMIDPKRLELSSYEGIPHLLHPVVVDPKLASQALKWAVGEMERRYKIISEVGAKGIDQYNRLIEQPGKKTATGKNGLKQTPMDELWSDNAEENGESVSLGIPLPAAKINSRDKLPYIVIVIDEMADLMMVAQRNVEESLARLAQMSRAAGIHLILATQRPSVDVITGIIKANFPTRISFQVSSKVDSRTILDQHGAEKLLGAGDMLFIPPGTSRLIRIHGVYVSDKEIEGIVAFIKNQAKPAYDETIVALEKEGEDAEKSAEEYDEKYDEAVLLVTELGHASISLVQRYMKIGYNRAARIIERMETEGVVGPSDGVKPRKVLARKIPR